VSREIQKQPIAVLNQGEKVTKLAEEILDGIVDWKAEING